MSLLRTALPRLFHAVPQRTARFSSLPSVLLKRSVPPPPRFALPRRGIATTVAQPTQVDWKAIGTRFGIAAVGAVGLHLALNRETRGALTEAEGSYLHETFAWTGAGLALTGLTAKFLHSSGQAARLMQLNPWVFMGVGLAASVGSMYGVFATEPNSPAHYACWAAVRRPCVSFLR